MLKTELFIFLNRLKTLFKFRGVKLASRVMIYPNCNLESEVSIGSNSILSNTNIDSYSYMGSNCRINYVSIGKFCSLGSDVKIGLSNHPTEKFVSTSPYFYLPNFNDNKSFVDNQLYNPIEPIKIGNDVWIGANVLINDGVIIGDGAVIAAGAVVTKNVEPYSIVGGVPAKEIKKRFTADIRMKLLKLKWWDKDINWIKKNVSKFSNIDDLLKNEL